jgi:DNA-binding transcriptional MerR regulator
MAQARYVKSGEAARHLGVSRTTLARWVRDGLVSPAFRSPRRRDMYFDLADLDRQLREAQRRGQG